MAYDLITSEGDVQPFGGAGFFGSRVSQNAPTAIVAAASSPYGLGYWLAARSGSIFPYGDAANYGSPRAEHLGFRVRAFGPTADQQGYWAVSAFGKVANFGDAPYCGSATGLSSSNQIAAVAGMPGNGGYLLATTTGEVLPFGDAVDLSKAYRVASNDRLVAIATTPDGGGYWLVTARGEVTAFGDARTFGSLAHRRHSGSIISFAPSPDGAGYLLATSTGRVYPFGDAVFLGSDAHNPPRRKTSIVAIVPTLATTTARYVPLPHEAMGYDVSNYQCQKGHLHDLGRHLPRTSQVSVIEVAGWLAGAYNPCLQAAAAWASKTARATGASYELYLFLNAPSSDATSARQDANGPRGPCASAPPRRKATCRAYNYGYNGARAALAYATGLGVHAVIWWVDIENATLSHSAFSNYAAGQFWSGSRALNADTVQGAFDALRGAGIEVGIYSSSLQYSKIVGRFAPKGAGRVPLWIAGVPWTHPPYASHALPGTSILSSWCAGKAIYSGTHSADLFANGVPWILQETPGATSDPPFGLDPDYTC